MGCGGRTTRRESKEFKHMDEEKTVGGSPEEAWEKMAEQAGRRGLPCIAAIADQMPGGFFIYRADEREEILYANDVLLDIFGCETMEQFRALTGGTFSGLVHPEDLEAVERSIKNQVTASRRKLDFVEYRVRRRDGAVRWVDDYGRLTQTEEFGEVYYVLIRDITELYESREENIRRAEVIEGLSIDYNSIYLLNLETGTMRPYRLQNQHFRTIAAELGDGEQDPDWRRILPLYAERYVVPEDRERFLREISEENIRPRLKQERSYTVDYRCRGEGDEILYTQMSVVLIEDGQGAPHAVMGYRDITAQTLRMRREMAEKLSMELALEREKSANEVKSEFLFNLSHDIRTPMNAIMGFTDLARRHAEDRERMTGYLEKVDEASRHLLSLIDDLLEMSQLQYGRIETHEETCTLPEQITITADMFRVQAEQKRLTLTVNLVDLPEEPVIADASRLRRGLGNLIGNAVKFTPDGGAVTVTARRTHMSESGYVRYQFSVADTGVGMSEAFMKRMYQQFEREESSTRSGSTGTGLGLSIAKRLLDIMGGSISVQSRKGEGSVFTVDLPLKLAGSPAATAAEAAQPEAEPKADGERRILLVEDIEINRMLAETILEEAGFLVESAPDGCDAVDMVRDHPEWYYDLVLMDIQMPVMNGYEATRAIRALDRRDAKLIPIVALSANSRDEDKRMSLESGMNNHVAKPFDVANLIHTVNAHIEETNREE